MKYVITKDELGRMYPVIFTELLNHSDVRFPGEVISAGFCSIVDDHFSVTKTGSVSLNVGSGKYDQLILNLCKYVGLGDPLILPTEVLSEYAYPIRRTKLTTQVYSPDLIESILNTVC